MIMHRGKVNPCFCNDMAQRCGGVSLFPDEPLGRVQNLFFSIYHSYDSIE